MNHLDIPQDRIAKRLEMNQKTIHYHLGKMAALPNSLNGYLRVTFRLSLGFTIESIAEKHGWPDPMVWSLALEGKNDRVNIQDSKEKAKSYGKFFLNAVIDTADDGKKTFLLILKLKKETDSFIISLGGRAENANRILELFYQKPALNVKEIEKSLLMNQRTIRNVLNILETESFVFEYTGNKRNKKYIFQRYLKLFY